MHGLNDKVAIVTGGGQGMGRALVLRLAAEGCRVAIFDLSVAAGEETASLAGNAAVKTYQVDVSDFAAVTAAVDAVEADLGPIWTLVNNAGWDKPQPFLATTPEFWDKSIARVNGFAIGGDKKARAMWYLNRMYSPQQALELGLEVLLRGRNLPGRATADAGLVDELVAPGDEVAAAEHWLLSDAAHSIQPSDRPEHFRAAHADSADTIAEYRAAELTRMLGHEPAPLTRPARRAYRPEKWRRGAMKCA